MSTLGNLSDSLFAKRAEIAKAESRVKELMAERGEIESKLIAEMKEAGTDIVRGKKATVSISETIRPQLQDQEAFNRFVLRKKALHLFERRIAVKAYQEMKDSLGGKDIPGVSEYVQTRLNVRAK